MKDVDGRDKPGHDEEGHPAFGWARAAAAGLTFRPITDTDMAFLARVYASTRLEELRVVPWSELEKAVFLQTQFDAQHAHYQKHYTDTDWLIILRGDEPIGRLYLARWQRQHRVVDITLLPAHRGAGLGAAILRDLIDEAAAAGKALTIHVEKINPALRLYRRLGFVKAGDEGIYDLMRWKRGSEGRHRE
jgi:GNAT superfamily N-acetyltransferase